MNTNNKDDVLDSKGNRPNPFNGQPYSNAYKEQAKIWSKFPVYLRAREIYDALKENQVILLTASTGSGKTRLLPLMCLKALEYQGRVIVTMPKKINVTQGADIAIKWFEAETLGKYIGQQYRGAPVGSRSEQTKLIFSTDGSVVQQLFNDPALSKFNYLVVDEAHERSVNIDLILLLAKKAMTLNPNLKLVIMSATIDPELFKKYYQSEFRFKYIDIAGATMYPIDVKYFDKPIANIETDQKQLIPVIVDLIIKIIQSGERGDIIAFINSANDASAACELLAEQVKKQGIKEPFCMEVYSGMPNETRNYIEKPNKYQVNNPGGKYDRRVMFGTSLIEAGISAPGFKIVIENGFSFQKGFNPERMEYSLGLKRISKQSVIQRRGRVGRLEPGVCYSLYTKEEYDKFPDFTSTEINNNDLTPYLLKFLVIPDVSDIKSLYDFIGKMIEPPKNIAINVGLLNLHAIGAIDLERGANGNILNGHISALGKLLLRFRKMEPQYALALLKSYAYGTDAEVAIIGVLLSEMEPAKGLTTYFDPPRKYNAKIPVEKKRFLDGEAVKKTLKHAYGDIFVIKKIYDKFVDYRSGHDVETSRKWCRKYFFDFDELEKINRRYRETMEESRQLRAEYVQLFQNKPELYKTKENNILHPLMEGLFTNLAFKAGSDAYMNCFPIIPTKAAIHKESMLHQLKTSSEYIMYIVLYNFMGRTGFVINTKVPKEILVNLPKDKLKLLVKCIKRNK